MTILYWTLQHNYKMMRDGYSNSSNPLFWVSYFAQFVTAFTFFSLLNEGKIFWGMVFLPIIIIAIMFLQGFFDALITDLIFKKPKNFFRLTDRNRKVVVTYYDGVRLVNEKQDHVDNIMQVIDNLDDGFEQQGWGTLNVFGKR